MENMVDAVEVSGDESPEFLRRVEAPSVAPEGVPFGEGETVAVQTEAEVGSVPLTDEQQAELTVQ
jgi:hypothetical protein